jgi:hypothetical protein
MQPQPSLARNWQQAQLLYLEGTPTTEIARLLGCKRGTLDARISRAGLPALREKKRQDHKGERTKQKIAQVAEDITDQLAVKTPKSAEGLNRHADTLGKVTKAAALVHGWSESSTVQVIVGGVHVGIAEPEDAEVIDIE